MRSQSSQTGNVRMCIVADESNRAKPEIALATLVHDSDVLSMSLLQELVLLTFMVHQ